ncbi:hypothetical protein ACWDTG_03975 [Rhodococcus zopfii]|uniref:Uncharacterized protein n=1 Tax=Rhodococcus zopfii TaxID=43772 RepID=A0ABU3WQR7_9NOCA|nr:hypothetical protein [Rhodococcus zopfii]MDV2476342.1 hypothetical protein [Rhodococcus zopfii]
MTGSARPDEFAGLPEADRIEQATDAYDDEAADDVVPDQVPLEVDPGDAVEQSLSVPEDEDYPRE